MVTIVWYTCNTLDPFLMQKCQEYLLKAAEGKRIISVSQKLLDFGDNLCVGEIGRSHISLFTQILVGAKAATTKYVALAEHDDLYSAEHFNWVPPRDDLFYYNTNHWFVKWGGVDSGAYSYQKRKVLSNLICNRELLIEAVEEKLAWLKGGAMIRKGQLGACEFGVCTNDRAFVGVGKDLGKDPKNYRAKEFSTKIPNIDIRHGMNFSGGRKAKQIKYSLPPWGSFHAVMGVMPPERWYQEAQIDGEWVPTRRQHDTNEKRWKKYLEPLIELKSGTVTDLGCNAGFYCRKMAERGFNAIGVERDFVALRHNHYWETRDPRGVKVVENDITQHEIGLSHYVFLANVHYWLTPEQLTKLVAQFREKALNVVLIGRYKQAPEHKSPVGLDFLKELFASWRMGKVIDGTKHFSVIFHNPDLVEKCVADLFPKQQLAKSERFLPSYGSLIDQVLSGESFDPKQTEYFKYLNWRRFKDTDKLLQSHIDLIHTVKDTGLQEPLVIGRVVNGKYAPERLVDGDHRLIIAYKLGIPTVICKVEQYV